MKDDKHNICLNCGRKLGHNNYCGNCGQPRSVGRLTVRSLSATLLSEYTRWDRGFLYTCKLLLATPWRVISDYIKGRRARYTGPIRMLVLLSLLQLLLSYIFDDQEWGGSAGQTLFEAESPLNDLGNTLVIWYFTSPVFQYVTMFLPALPVFMLITKKDGKHFYNFAESLLSTMYASSTMFIAALIATPLELLPIDLGLPDNWILPAVLYIAIVGGIGIYKSLSPLQLTKKRKIKRVITFFFFTSLIYIMLSVAFVLSVYFFLLK